MWGCSSRFPPVRSDRLSQLRRSLAARSPSARTVCRNTRQRGVQRKDQRTLEAGPVDKTWGKWGQPDLTSAWTVPTANGGFEGEVLQQRPWVTEGATTCQVSSIFYICPSDVFFPTMSLSVTTKIRLGSLRWQSVVSYSVANRVPLCMTSLVSSRWCKCCINRRSFNTWALGILPWFGPCSSPTQWF